MESGIQKQKQSRKRDTESKINDTKIKEFDIA